MSSRLQSTAPQPGGDADEPGEDGADSSGRWRVLTGLRRRSRRAGLADFTVPAATRLCLLAMVAAMLSGPVALVLEATDRPAPAPAAAATGSTDGVGREQLRAGQAAAGLVRIWLSAGAGDAAAVRAVMGRDPGPLVLPAKRPSPPAWVAVTDARRSAAGEWSVTVTAGDEASPGAAYMVVVAVDHEQAAAMTLPARIPLPSVTGRRSELAVLAGVDPVTVTVTGFLQSMLTGADDLSRWLAPDSPVKPTGRDCDTVTVPRVETVPGIGDPTATTITVLATAVCQYGHGADRRTLQYPLTLQLRDDRWEVVDYSPTLPTTQPTTPAGTPTPTPTTPTPSR